MERFNEYKFCIHNCPSRISLQNLNQPFSRFARYKREHLLLFTMKTTHSQILVLFLFLLLSLSLFGQKNSSKPITTETKEYNWKVGLNAGVGVSSSNNDGGKWDGQWSVPDLSFSEELFVSRRLKNDFWINTGVAYDSYSYRSKAFVHSGTGVYYSQGPNGLTANYYSFTDNYERYSYRTNSYISIPLLVEYSSSKKIGMYGRAGIRFSLPFLGEVGNRRVDNNYVITTNSPVGLVGSSSQRSLFGHAAVGLQCRFGKTIGNLGLTYSHGLLGEWNGDRPNFPNALRVEVGIQGYLDGKKVDVSNQREEGSDRKKREYVYLEVSGNRLNYSMNFEHALIAGRQIRWNLRVGGALKNRVESLERLGITGTSVTFGNVHALEVGFNVQFYQQGDNEMDYAYAPTLGYRFEPADGRFFGRAVYTPVGYQSLKYYCSFMNCAEHYGAVSVGVKF